MEIASYSYPDSKDRSLVWSISGLPGGLPRGKAASGIFRLGAGADF